MDRYRCVSRYRAGELAFQPGDLLPETAEVVEHLLRDSPGSFEKVVAASPSQQDSGAVTVSDGGEGEVSSVSASPDPPAPPRPSVPPPLRQTAWTPKRTKVQR